jgi:hypothetical protein
MIANCEVDIITGTPTVNGWGDTVISESLTATVPGHVGTDAQISGKDVTDASGLTSQRCRIRIPNGTVVPPDSVFRIDGIRWKPVAGKTARSVQNWTIYDCQRIE